MALAALAAASYGAAFYSLCPKHSFSVGSAIVSVGTLSCEQEDAAKLQDGNPTKKVLRGGI